MSKIDPQFQPFLDILDEIREMHLSKSADYGSDEDAYANLHAAAAFGVEPWIAAMVRLNDKIVRVQSFCMKGDLLNESVADSLIDIAVYGVLALKLYREEE